MTKRGAAVRKNVMLEESKVKRLVERLGARSESEAIRKAIDVFLFANEVMTHVRRARIVGVRRRDHRSAGFS